MLFSRVCNCLILALVLKFNAVSAQDSSGVEKMISFPEKLFGSLDKKISGVEKRLNTQTEKYLNSLESEEQKLKKKLWRKDSLLAKQIFPDIRGEYEEFRQR